MKKIALVGAILAAAGVFWFLAGQTSAAPEKHVHEATGMEVEFLGMAPGKVLYVVVDKDGVYLGDTHFDLAGAKTGIRALLKEQKIKNLVIYGTIVARYGDVIELRDSIDPALVRHSTLSVRPLSPGTRKPLTGLLQARCCYVEDVENPDHGD